MLINCKQLKLLLSNISDRADRFCRCPPNFKGRYCAEDVDECSSPNACDKHEICSNTYGSYECSCENGYIRERLQCISMYLTKFSKNAFRVQCIFIKGIPNM